MSIAENSAKREMLQHKRFSRGPYPGNSTDRKRLDLSSVQPSAECLDARALWMTWDSLCLQGSNRKTKYDWCPMQPLPSKPSKSSSSPTTLPSTPRVTPSHWSVLVRRFQWNSGGHMLPRLQEWNSSNHLSSPWEGEGLGERLVPVKNDVIEHGIRKRLLDIWSLAGDAISRQNLHTSVKSNHVWRGERWNVSTPSTWFAMTTLSQ